MAHTLKLVAWGALQGTEDTCISNIIEWARNVAGYGLVLKVHPSSFTAATGGLAPQPLRWAPTWKLCPGSPILLPLHVASEWLPSGRGRVPKHQTPLAVVNEQNQRIQITYGKKCLIVEWMTTDALGIFFVSSF